MSERSRTHHAGEEVVPYTDFKQLYELESTVKPLHFIPFWSAEDIAVLINLYQQGKTQKEIASIMGRTISAVNTKVSRLGIAKPRWTVKDK